MGAFGARLVQTATWYPGSRILRGSEAYTSKQCGRCGTLNDKLAGSEVFKCSACDAVADRDVHAARNILLRFCE
jgi:putative transposase